MALPAVMSDGLLQGLLVSLASEGAEWESWWKSMEPERTALPDMWQQKCRPLQRCCLSASSGLSVLVPAMKATDL